MLSNMPPLFLFWRLFFLNYSKSTAGSFASLFNFLSHLALVMSSRVEQYRKTDQMNETVYVTDMDWPVNDRLI